VKAFVLRNRFLLMDITLTVLNASVWKYLVFKLFGGSKVRFSLLIHILVSLYLCKRACDMMTFSV
jgi:hypothetical protein